MPYTFEVRTTKRNLNADIWDLKGGSWKVTSKEYTMIVFDYTDNRFTVTVFDPQKEEAEYGATFSINSIGDAFWMILSMTASGYFEFKYNEPLQILRKAL